MKNTTELIKQMDRVFELQKKAFAKEPMPGAEKRIGTLRKLKKALIASQEDLFEAVNDDFGCRSREETILAEIIPSLEGLSFASKNIKGWMKPVCRKVGLPFQPAKSQIHYQPLGVVGIISPWNYPINLTLALLTGAIAAGNRVMIKMSEYTPKTALAVQRLISEVFDEDQVCVITGDAEVAISFSKKPFGHLLFTGSTSVGRHVMKAASENLTPVTLELGGKSPAIIGADITLSEVAKIIGFGKTFNAGQTCIAPDYVLCPKEGQNDLLKSLNRLYR